MSFTSELMSLEDIVNKGRAYTVPIYQRLYVWGEDQVRTLVEDLLAACKRGDENYYLGGTIVVDREGAGRTLELVDGQQRFTTLWLVSLVWKGSLQDFMYVQQGSKRHARIQFDIRDKVNDFFQGWLAKTNDVQGFNETVERDESLVSILDALDTIRACAAAQNVQDEKLRVSTEDFVKYVFSNVKFVETRVPPGTDMNKLFEVINNRGVQLQHHEILKARMLDALRGSTEVSPLAYANMWDACSGMDNYVERNLRALSDAPLTVLFSNEESDRNDEALGKGAAVAGFFTEKNADEGPEELSLERILDGATIEDGCEHGKQVETEADKVRSIFAFPVLLQHALRIWLFERAKKVGLAGDVRVDLDRIAEKDLLKIFEECFFSVESSHWEKNVKEFIELLWELRYLFDKYIVKWVNQGEEEVLLVRRLRKSTDEEALRRSSEELEGLRGFSLLQGMLYHSQQITTQYWITPLLYFLYSHRGQGGLVEQATAFLRHVDTQLFCTGSSGPLIERTREFMSEPWKMNAPDCRILEKKEGLKFPHYWFYKLEYVLWYYLSEDGQMAKDLLANRGIIGERNLTRFRITARNSIEHIFPQTPRADIVVTVSKSWREAFGNLALVSRGLNSEYSNKSFLEKRGRFIDTNVVRVDSLKSALIYAHEEWSDAEVERHGATMAEVMRIYLDTNWNDGRDIAPLGSAVSEQPHPAL